MNNVLYLNEIKAIKQSNISTKHESNFLFHSLYSPQNEVMWRQLHSVVIRVELLNILNLCF